MEPAAVGSSWSVLRYIKFAVYGAVCARITIFIIRRFREATGPPRSVDKWSLADVANHVENAKEAAKQAREELKDKAVAGAEQLAEGVAEVKEEVEEAIGEFTEDLKDRLLGPEVREALGTIQYLIENVHQSVDDRAEYTLPSLLLLALVRRVEEDQLADWRLGLPAEPTKISSEEAVSVSRTAQFALSTYAASWGEGEAAVAREMGVEPEDVVFTWCRDDQEGKMCPKFIIILDHESESVVLAIRGTFCLKDVILDMVCDDAPYLDGFAHRGILEGAERVWEEGSPALLAALALHPAYSLVLTGHSLGAGTAVLLALELLAGEGAALLPGTPVCCLALAPPPVYRAATSWLGDTALPPLVKERVQILVHRHDCVPCMSLASLARLAACLRAVDLLGLGLTEAVSALAPGTSGQAARAQVAEVLAEVRQDVFPFLQHPGSILYLEPAGAEGEYRAVPQTSERFTASLQVVSSMVTDHRMESYQAAVHGLARAVLGAS